MTEPTPGWLDLEPPSQNARKRRKRTRKSKKARAAKKRKIEVVASNAIPREAARRFGDGRIWGCDGSYVFWRPKRMIEGVFTQVANPEAMERHQRFLQLGHYEYIETQDDVQIFRVTDASPFKRKFGSLRGMSESTIKRAVIMAAVKREWTLYVDALEELAALLQSGIRAADGQGYGALHANQWKEMLAYIELQIQMRGGPTSAECALNLSRIRADRNGGSGKRILVT
jgi:hypothetical protein